MRLHTYVPTELLRYGHTQLDSYLPAYIEQRFSPYTAASLPNYRPIGLRGYRATRIIRKPQSDI